MLCALLSMFGLRSVPIRWIVRGMALLSGLLLARFGELSATGRGSRVVEGVDLAPRTAAALVLAPSSRAVPGREPGVIIRAQDLPPAVQQSVGAVRRTRPHADAGHHTSTPAVPSRDGHPPAVPSSLVVAAVVLVGATALLVGPRTSLAFPTGAKAGEVIDLLDNRGDNALVAQDSLDMTTRPRLTDEVVMTVRSQIASFWRTETYDRWNGSQWSRSDGLAGDFLDRWAGRRPDEDLAALDGVDSVQEFRIETGFATAVPTAPTPLQVDSAQPLAQRHDSTLISPVRPLGSRHRAYTVISRQVPTARDLLAAAEIERCRTRSLEQYAAPPVATDRTLELARTVTDGASNDFDRVRAIEQWLDDNTEYSLDAPLSPKGVDVVDDFLFESRLGWCEQIARSLVVLARLSAACPAHGHGVRARDVGSRGQPVRRAGT